MPTDPLSDIGIDDEIGDAELVFERHENDALRSSWPLPHEHEAGQFDGRAGLGGIETPRVMIAELREGRPQQGEGGLTQRQPGRGVVHDDRLAGGLGGRLP